MHNWWQFDDGNLKIGVSWLPRSPLFNAHQLSAWSVQCIFMANLAHAGHTKCAPHLSSCSYRIIRNQVSSGYVNFDKIRGYASNGTSPVYSRIPPLSLIDHVAVVAVISGKRTMKWEEIFNRVLSVRVGTRLCLSYISWWYSNISVYFYERRYAHGMCYEKAEEPPQTVLCGSLNSGYTRLQFN